jgi:hypothetical protein
MIFQHATERAESVRPLSNDERRAHWAARYFGAGYHLRPSKPRVRAVTPSTTEPAPAGKDSSK